MVWHRKNLPKSLPKSVPTIQNGCCPNWSVWPRDECLCYLQLHINPVNKFMREKRNHMRASHSFSLSHTLALSHSVFLSLSHSHTHTHTLTHSHALSPTYLQPQPFTPWCRHLVPRCIFSSSNHFTQPKNIGWVLRASLSSNVAP